MDYTKYCDLETVQVDNSVVMSSDTMSFNIILRGELPMPKDGNEIIWLVNGIREFGGVVTSVEETDLGVDLQYKVSANSYVRWLDRRLVVGYYEQMPASEMVKQVVSGFCPGFDTNNVQPSYNMPPHFFNYVAPSDAIKRIAQQIEWGWYCDYYRSIHFYSFESFPSPLANNTLSVDTDVTNYGDLVLKTDANQLKTRIYLKGFKTRVGSPITLNFTADGNTKQWNLGYTPSKLQNDVVVKVGGATLTTKRDMTDGSPEANTTDTTSAFINYQQNLMRVNFTPASGTVVSVTMYYLADTIVMREDPVAENEAAAADGNGDGRYEYAITEKGLSQATLDAAIARGDQMLYKYAYPLVSGTFNSFTQGWRAGQSFQMKSTRRLGGIDTKMYVREVHKTIAQATDAGVVIQYAISIADVAYLV